MRITIYEVSEGMIHVMDSSTFCCSARFCSWFRRTFIRKSLTSSQLMSNWNLTSSLKPARRNKIHTSNKNYT